MCLILPSRPGAPKIAKDEDSHFVKDDAEPLDLARRKFNSMAGSYYLPQEFPRQFIFSISRLFISCPFA